MIRSQFATFVAVCGTTALVGWFGFDPPAIESPATSISDTDATGSVNPLIAETRPVDAPPAIAMNSVGEPATSGPDSTEPAILSAGASAAETRVVEAPLRESRPPSPPEKPVQLALASPSDALNESASLAAQPATPISDPDATGSVIPLAAETRAVDAPPATAMDSVGEAATSSDPDSTEPAILDAGDSAAETPVVEAPLPDSRPPLPPEKPVQLALASPSDALNESPGLAARPATPISDPDATGSVIPLGAAETRPVDAPPATAMDSPGETLAPDPDTTELAVALAGAPAAETPIVVAALPDSRPPLPPEKPVRLVSAFPSSAVNDPMPAVRPLGTPNECLVEDICIDDYLWSLYERTPKVDTNKVTEKIKKTIKRKGKLRTVTRTIVKYVVGDFTWKDPIAAKKAGMSLKDYVIGGMDRGFKRKLYRALRAVEEAGFMPGITSAFRDDYRQAIATGNKASSDSSYHGGSRRGGYGHGLAVDLVSVEGDTRMERLAASDELWKWIDAHEKELGIGRPYRDRDPPHIGPIDGKEYAVKRALRNAQKAGKAKRAQAAQSQTKKPATTARANPGTTKRASPEKPSKVSGLQTRAVVQR